MLAAGAGMACRDATQPIKVEPLPTTFLFVKGPAGDAQIYRWYADSIHALTSGPGENVEPSSAAGMLVFTSYRDGNAELYLANLDGSNQHRIVTSPAFDHQADLSPDASRIVFVSTRTGAQRLYLADSSGANLAALATGSAANVPETGPTWSPEGGRITFASSRTGTSQIFVVDAAGGMATQVSHEAVGAFDPSWSAGGDTIFYVAALGTTQIRATRLSTGTTITFPVAAAGYAQPACAAFGCLAVRDPYGSSSEIVGLQLNGRRVTSFSTGAPVSRDPALIR